MAKKASTKKSSKKTELRNRRQLPSTCRFCIYSTFGNTIATLTDINTGNVLLWASGGTCGFKNTKKKTPFTAKIVVKHLIKIAKESGVENVHVCVKGGGWGKTAAIWSLCKCGLKIKSLRSRSLIPHNGCRPRHKRRIKRRTKREGKRLSLRKRLRPYRNPCARTKIIALWKKHESRN
jgi:small subunit ribosomal protein S11